MRQLSMMPTRIIRNITGISCKDRRSAERLGVSWFLCLLRFADKGK